MLDDYRILRSIQQLASSFSIPENATNNSTIFSQNNFAILVQDIDQNRFQGQTFSAILGSADQAINSNEEIDPSDLIVMPDPVPNATVSATLPPSVVTDNCPAFDRIFYIVHVTNTLFLTPETNCEDYTIGSIVITVGMNGCSNFSEEIELDFDQLDEVG